MKIKFLICLLKFSFRPLFITAPSMAAEEMKIEILICGRTTDKLGREIQGATSNKSNSSECRFIINMGENKQINKLLISHHYFHDRFEFFSWVGSALSRCQRMNCTKSTNFINRFAISFLDIYQILQHLPILPNLSTGLQ